MFHFLLCVSLSLSLLISFIFSILLCFGVVKRGPYHHLFCVIRSVIVLFRFAVRFCRSHIHSVRVDSVRSGVARATIQTYRLTFPPLFMASMPRFRQKSKHKNDRETRIGSHTHTHTQNERKKRVFRSTIITVSAFDIHVARTFLIFFSPVAIFVAVFCCIKTSDARVS